MKTKTENLPERVVAAMRDMLAEYRALAASHESPGDGTMLTIGQDKIIDGGCWNGGWSLQVCLIEDARMFEGPHLVVHAYSESQLTKGYIRVAMVWTPAEKRALDQKRLDRMVAERDRLNAAITALTKKMEISS